MPGYNEVHFATLADLAVSWCWGYCGSVKGCFSPGCSCQSRDFNGGVKMQKVNEEIDMGGTEQSDGANWTTKVKSTIPTLYHPNRRQPLQTKALGVIGNPNTHTHTLDRLMQWYSTVHIPHLKKGETVELLS